MESPRGWLFSSGYWDYAPFARGLLFAPVYFADRAFLYGSGFLFRPSFALGYGGVLRDPACTVGEAMLMLAEIGEKFRREYHEMLRAVLALKKPMWTPALM